MSRTLRVVTLWVLLPLTLAATGCASREERMSTRARKTCVDNGYGLGTAAFNECFSTAYGANMGVPLGSTVRMGQPQQ
ncbi:hypothetical protein [Roseomonas elaeocarpi]|uniref:Lipoprotein n=1 Tax=Roseomonas elaeocarpi TaxID=907779 RepID=A0ABV6JTS0_9PROT